MMKKIKSAIPSNGASLFLNIERVLSSRDGGTEMTGTAYLKVEMEIPADSLTLHFHGREQCQVTYKEKLRDFGQSETWRESITRTRRAQEERSVVVIEYVLTSFVTGKISQGEYEFPFGLSLPKNLPGTQGQITSENWFVVQYLLEARLHKFGLLSWDVKCSSEVNIAGTLCSDMLLPSIKAPHTVPVYKFCCYRAGTVSLFANVNSTELGFNEKFKVTYGILNASSLRVVALEVRVVMLTKFFAQGQESSFKKSIVKHRIEGDALKGAEPMKIKSGRLMDNTPSATYFVEITLPSVDATGTALRPTYRAGGLALIEYRVEVEAVTAFGSENVMIPIPVTVHTARHAPSSSSSFSDAVEIPQPDRSPLQLPQSWNAMPNPRVVLTPFNEVVMAQRQTSTDSDVRVGGSEMMKGSRATYGSDASGSMVGGSLVLRRGIGAIARPSCMPDGRDTELSAFGLDTVEEE